MPIFASSVFCPRGSEASILKIFRIKNSQINEKNTRYQVSSPSLREMSLPNMPVKPARITAVCSIKYDLFIKRLPSVARTIF